MQGLLLACLLAQQEAGLGAKGERRLKPLAAAWSSGRSKISDNSTLEVTVMSVLKLSYFCLHFPAKGKVDFQQGWDLVSSPDTVGGCLGNRTAFTSHRRKGDEKEK